MLETQFNKSSIETTENGNTVISCRSTSEEEDLNNLFDEIESPRSADELKTYIESL